MLFCCKKRCYVLEKKCKNYSVAKCKKFWRTEPVSVFFLRNNANCRKKCFNYFETQELDIFMTIYFKSDFQCTFLPFVLF